MRSLKFGLLCVGLAWLSLTRPALAQVPPHAPGTICFTPSFCVGRSGRGRPARHVGVLDRMVLCRARLG